MKSCFSPWAVVLGVAFYVTIAFNTTLFSTIHALVGQSGPSGWLVVSTFGALVFLASVFVFFCVAHPRLLRGAVVLAVLIGAPVAYLGNEYGMGIDHRLLATALATDHAEAGDLITLKFLIWFLLLGVLPALVLSRIDIRHPAPTTRVWQNGLGMTASAVMFAALLLTTYGDVSSLLREQRQIVGLITPANTLLAIANHVWRTSSTLKATASTPIERIALGVAPHDTGHTPSVTVLVVGETARADHFSINGYERPTTPRLAAIQGLINFPNAKSCATLTAESLPCMFSGLGRDGNVKNIAHNRENLLDLMKGAEFDVVWIDNQSGCKELCARVETVMTAARQDPKFCATGECHDEIMIDEVKKRLAAPTRDTVIVLHMMGSHGPAYGKRYPASFEVFSPACRSAEFSRCTRDQIIAAYDNTVRYTDHVLGELIDALDGASRAGTPTSLVYMSDHGESLGESGLYLHGVPYLFAPRAQTHVPFVIWMSTAFRNRHHIDADCLRDAATLAVSHDHLFHTVLGLLDVRSAAREDRLNLMRTCRQNG